MNLLKRIALILLFGTTAFTLNSCQCSESFGLNVDPDFKYIGDIALKILSETTNNQEVDMLVGFVNDAEKSCCNKSKSTNAHDFKVNIYYDSLNANPSNWGKPNQTGSIDKKALSPCEEDNGGTTTTFLKNGFYLVEMLLDFLDDTKERSENNNNSNKRKSAVVTPNVFKENEKYGNNRVYKIIHVTGLDDSNAKQACIINTIY